MAVDEDRVSVSHLRCWVGTGWIANAMGCLHVSSKGVIPPKELATLITGKVLHPQVHNVVMVVSGSFLGVCVSALSTRIVLDPHMGFQVPF